MIGFLVGLILSLLAVKPLPVVSPLQGNWPIDRQKQLASHEFSLSKRSEQSFVNRVFRQNILLTLAYMREAVNAGHPVNWHEVEKPFHWAFTLSPNQSLSYHAIRLPKYQTATPLTNLNFIASEGFLSDGWLVGDGTCHLASLIAWVARDAGLTVEAPTNHNFAPIPEVPKADSVSIYSQPHSPGSSALQNLYIQNNHGQSVQFVFDYQSDKLRVSVQEAFSDLSSVKASGSQL